jgi:hypothetical protein
MAEPEEDFSSLPLPDRFQHKVGTPQISRLLVYDSLIFTFTVGLESAESGI